MQEEMDLHFPNDPDPSSNMSVLTDGLSSSMHEKIPLRRANYVTLGQLAEFYQIDPSQCIVTKQENENRGADDQDTESASEKGCHRNVNSASSSSGDLSTTSVDLSNNEENRLTGRGSMGDDHRRAPGLRATTKKIFPPSGGYNLCLLIGEISIVVDKQRVDGSKVRLAEVLLGDESGTVSFRARDEQIELLQNIRNAGKGDAQPAVVLRNCTVELYQNKHLRLAVTKWGKICSRSEDVIDSTPQPPRNMNKTLNFSLADLSSRSAVQEAQNDHFGTYTKNRLQTPHSGGTYGSPYNRSRASVLNQFPASPHSPNVYGAYHQIPLYPWAPPVTNDGHMSPHSPYNYRFSWKHHLNQSPHVAMENLNIPLPYEASAMDASTSRISIPTPSEEHFVKTNDEKLKKQDGDKKEGANADKFAHYHNLGGSQLAYYQMMQQYEQSYGPMAGSFGPYYGAHGHQDAAFNQKMMQTAFDVSVPPTTYVRNQAAESASYHSSQAAYSQINAGSPQYVQQAYNVGMASFPVPYFAPPMPLSPQRNGRHSMPRRQNLSERSVGSMGWSEASYHSFSELPTAVSLAVFGGGEVSAAGPEQTMIRETGPDPRTSESDQAPNTQ